jgi:excisionase family DNA binding protein
LAPGHLGSYPVDNTGVAGGAGSHTVAPLPPVATPFGALVVHDAVGRLLTVREVADRLRVSRATVYRLVQAGALPTLRVSNSIRVPNEALEQAITSTAGVPLPSAPTLAIRGGRGAHGPSPAAP